MGTANFYFKNRCIVVSNEDMESENTPSYSKKESNISLRSFPCYPLEGYDDELKLVELTINSAYYEGACIDWHFNDNTAGSIIGLDLYDHCPTTSELFKDIKEFFPSLSKKAFRNAVHSIREKMGLKGYERIAKGDEWDYIEEIDNAITEWLREKEAERANEELTRIKALYGYDEYKVIGRFSNGETLYQRAW